jgi:uncharacterized protein (DUF2147 family)
MKKTILSILILLLATTSFSQTVIGKWKTIDDESGDAKSIVEIYEKSGKIHGRIIEILEERNRNRICNLCSGVNKDQPILGMNFITGLSKDDNEYNGGKIIDPQNGKEYKCFITLDKKDKLKVRGYIGISLLGRTQYWYRVK